MRVFYDRMNTVADRDQMKAFLDGQLDSVFNCNYDEHCTTDGADAIMVDFLTENA
jgi:hypothetical protein